MFHSCGKVEVLVTPVFQLRVQRIGVSITSLLIDPMKEFRIIIEKVVRRQVSSSSKPAIPILKLEVTDISTKCRHHGRL